MFKYEVTIKLSDTDATGRIFYTSQLQHASAGFEEWMEHLGIGLSKILAQGECAFPIIHVETDFKSPMKLGDRVSFYIFIDRLGDSSFSWSYQVMDQNKKELGTGKTVHVCVDQKTERKRLLPEIFAQTLSQQLRFSSSAFAQSRSLSSDLA